MIRRARLWKVIAALFTLVNVVSAGFAAFAGEGIHTSIHVALALLGGWWMWRLGRRPEGQQLASEQFSGEHLPDEQLGGEAVPAERLDLLQQSVDAIAIEVERIGEAQRFNAKVAQERGETPA